jgi:hypothetical protein
VSLKSFSALSILTAIALFGALTVIATDRDVGLAIGVDEAAIPELLQKINDVEKIIIDHSGGKITLISDEGGWVVEEVSGYKARTAKIKRAILGLAQLKLSEPKTRLESNYSKLELLDPITKGAKSKQVHLLDRRGRTIGNIIVGKRRPSISGTTSGGLYIRNPGKSQTWLAEGDVDISNNITEWLERKIVNLNSKRVKKVTIRHADGEILEVSKKTPEEPLFSLKSIPAYKKIASKTEPSTIGKALENLMLDDAKKEAFAPPLDVEKSLVADFTTFDGLEIRLHLFNQDEKFWVIIEASGKHKDAAKISKRTKGWVYQIANYSASILTRRMKDLVEDAKPKS